MRTETVLRKTLHHPLVYFLTFLVVVVGSLSTGVIGAMGAGLVAAIVVAFLTGLLP